MKSATSASMSKAMSSTWFLMHHQKGKSKKTPWDYSQATDEAIANIYEISNNKIVSGVKYTVSNQHYAIAVPSSNVATVMFANYPVTTILTNGLIERKV